MSDQIVETPAVATETPAAASAVTETPKETFDQTLARVADEVVNGKRGSNGQFQSRVVAPGAPETAEVPGRPEAAAPELAQPAIDAPQSLPDDVKKAWSTLPRAIQEAWSKREGEAHEKITADGQRLKSLSAFEEVVKPLESRLKQINAPAPEYFRRLAAADQLLATDGIRGIQQIAHMYGIDLRAALNGNTPNPNPTYQQQPQNVETLVDERVQQVLHRQRVTERQGEIDKFKTGLPADEQGDFDKLEAVMVGLVQANPNWTLDKLYKAARKVDPDISSKDEAKAAEAQRQAAAEDEKKRQAEAQRLAPLAKKPGSTPSGPIKGKTIWETMDKVGKEVLARR